MIVSSFPSDPSRSRAVRWALGILLAFALGAALCAGPASAATPRVLVLHFSPDLEIDPVTTDLLHKIVGDLEKRHWMLEAERAPDRGVRFAPSGGSAGNQSSSTCSSV